MLTFALLSVALAAPQDPTRIEACKTAKVLEIDVEPPVLRDRRVPSLCDSQL